jgi:hypothetical protein
MQFPRIEITTIILEAQKKLGVTKGQIFRQAGLSPTNFEKWSKGTSPTKRTENLILDAIEKLSSVRPVKAERGEKRIAMEAK